MFNKVIIIGHLTRDVELKHLNTGVALANIGLASNSRYKKQDGTYAEDTCFVDITLFGRTAEIAHQYLKKGSKVLIEGRLRYENWTDQQGNKRSKHSITAESLEMLDKKEQSDNSGYGSYGGGYGSGYNSGSNYGSGSYGNNSYGSGSYGNSSYGNSRNPGYGSGYGQSQNKPNSKNNEPPEIDVNEEEIPF